MKRFLISLAVMFGITASSSACGYDEVPGRYYMFCFCENSFSQKNQDEIDAFWLKYCNAEYYCSHGDMVKAAKKKGDTEMQQYLAQLEKLDDVFISVKNDVWDYPTATQLAARKRTLQGIVAACKSHANGKYANRWTLLNMRANMYLNAHQANITLWNTKASKYPNDCYKEKMRNIYARDLLLTGQKKQAWNIYAEQNDQQSLLWSVRKYTNLAGIKTLCAEDPNAPVLNYLVQTYVNRIQSLLEEEENGYALHLDLTNVIWGKAYAQVGSNKPSEFKSFAAFAKNMAENGKTKNPCMWMSASALVNYYLRDYKQAKACIDKAMDMKGTQAMKDNARRIRMMIEPSVANVQSDSFKEFMVQEMNWLDGCASEKDNTAAREARSRILNHVLSTEYSRCGNNNLAMGLVAVSVLNEYNEIDIESLKTENDDCFDYSTRSFSDIDKMTGSEIIGYFQSIENPGSDPLQRYVAAKLNSKYTENYKNDVIGTKLLAENKLAEALPYLQKVSMQYLNKQAIRTYAAQRDYKTPAWNGYKRINYDLETSLKNNVKVEFCKEVIALKNQYAIADFDARKEIAYKLATYYYQASYKGQCWFITHYSQSAYDEQNPKEANFPDITRKYLEDAATATDNAIKTAALFGKVGTATDEWMTKDYSYEKNEYVVNINTYSQQYLYLKQLDNFIKTTGNEPSYVSKCDVIKQFRRHK